MPAPATELRRLALFMFFVGVPASLLLLPLLLLLLMSNPLLLLSSSIPLACSLASPKHLVSCLLGLVPFREAFFENG